jgi:MFS family permease
VTTATASTTHRTPLDPLVRRIFVGFAFSALGGGLTMPFLYVYLAEVRGIPTTTVGLLFAWMGVLGFAGSPVGGTLIDRFGPRPIIVSGLCVETLGTVALSQVTGTWGAFLVATFLSIGTLGLYPASTAMLTRLVPEERRQKVYGVQFMLLNAGLGVGGVISGLLVDMHDPASFQRLYYLDAASYLGYVAVVVSLPRGTGALPAKDPDGIVDVLTPQPGWRTVLRDRTLLRVVVASVVTITFGYAQFQAGFSAYVVGVAGVDARWLGWAFGANTAAIVLGQLVTLRLVKGRSRTRMLALAVAIWAVSWAVIVSSDLVSGSAAVTLVIVGLGVFGVGETLWAPVAPAIVNDLATEELRGRYNALQGMTWTVAMVIGPALSGLLIGNGLVGAWVALVVGGSAAGSLLFWRLGRHLTPAQDGRVPAEVELAA